ncbi:uncharacterized protein LOC112002263 [Quercus suber]|uniref:uncharacterized protein LOC112002263 n=1 Tax=Quercus suber TaxID=58331 RepID=UPI0032DF4FBC
MAANASSAFMYFCAFRSISAIVFGGFFVSDETSSLDLNPTLKVVSYTLSSASSTSSVSRVKRFTYDLRVSFSPCLMLVNTAIHVSKITSTNRFEAIYLNGVHHWVGFMNNGDINELGEDRDPQLDDVSTMEKTFAVLNDCLAFIVYNDESTMTEKYFDIWVMREYVVEDSWTKQLVVGPLLGIKEPLGFAKNGELLLRGGDEAIILYNIDSQEMKNLQCGGFPSTAMIYVESLVSFPSGNLS